MVTRERQGFKASILQAKILFRFFLDEEMTDEDFRDGCARLLKVVPLVDVKIILTKLSNDHRLADQDYFEELERMGYDRSRYVPEGFLCD